MTNFEPTINHKIPCVHSNHLFKNPLCKDLPLGKRIGNVMFHILFLVGIPLGIYKLYKFCASKNSGKNTPEKQLQALGIDPGSPKESQDEEKKKAIIAQLPQWFMNHFPEKSFKNLEIIYKDRGWIIDLSQNPNKSIDESLNSLKETIVNDLANPWFKTNYALQALTLPKDNPILCEIVKEILHSAWEKALLNSNNPFNFMFARAHEYLHGYISVDSRAILIEELHKHADKIPEVERKDWIDRVKKSEVHNRLDISVPDSGYFTIHVNAPK